MFTALVLICAGGVKDLDTCYYSAHPKFFDTEENCVVTIYKSVSENIELFEWRDETLDVDWKVTDYKCIDWNATKV